MIHSQNLFSTFFDTCWSVVLFLWMVMFVFLCFVKRYIRFVFHIIVSLPSCWSLVRLKCDSVFFYNLLSSSLRVEVSCNRSSLLSLICRWSFFTNQIFTNVDNDIHSFVLPEPRTQLISIIIYKQTFSVTNFQRR